MENKKYSNGVVSVGLDEDYIERYEEKYNIILESSNKKIGNIIISYKIIDGFLANMQYELVKEARGNGYMLQSLELLREPLIENGLTKPHISVDPENYPSIRVIEKFGGKKIDNGDEWYDTYEVDLEDKPKSK